jgi:LCP family protein required for cell wall assembly
MADEADVRGSSSEPVAQDDGSEQESSAVVVEERSDEEPPVERRRTRSRRRTLIRRTLIGAGILAVILAVLVGGGIWFVTERYAGNVDRIDNVFSGIDESTRPAPATSQDVPSEQPITFLLVGSDTRGHPADGEDPDGRSDAIMIARLSADRQHAQIISIPRDSWVSIPGHGYSKINAAYAWGGPTLLIETVEQLTQVRIDHYVAIDFDGITEVTDALGGVDVEVAETTSHGPYTYPAGLNHLNGDQARWYLGQRYGLPGGDFDRERRQQQYLRSVFTKLFSSDTFHDLGKLDESLRILTGSVSVDDTLTSTDMLTMAYSMRNLTPADVQFFTTPVLGTGMEGAASVVYLDTTTAERMWTYLRSDSLAQNVAEFSKQALPDVPR